jgi:CHAD domain-containing protein
MAIASQRVQFVFQKAERDLVKLAAGTEPDTVHSFRTTTRRLQTLLEELLPERSRNQKTLLKLLDEIRRRAGKVRDIDVQIAALRALKTAQEPRRKTQLLQQLIELRAKHEKKLCKSLTSGTIREARKRLKRAQKQIDLETSRDPLTVARGMLARVATKDAFDEDHLHAFRILVKRSRYVAEFAKKDSEATQFIADLKRLQDALGTWHDWLTLTHSAAGRLGEVHESSLVAALHNVTGGKFRAALAAMKASSILAPSQKPPAASQSGSSKKGGQPERSDSAA